MTSGWKRLSAWMNARPRASRLNAPVEKSRAGRRLSTGRSAKPMERTARNSPVARSYTCRSGDKGHLKHPSASSFSWRRTQAAAFSGTSSPLASATRATHRPAASTSAPTSACTVAIPSHTPRLPTYERLSHLSWVASALLTVHLAQFSALAKPPPAGISAPARTPFSPAADSGRGRIAVSRASPEEKRSRQTSPPGSTRHPRTRERARETAGDDERARAKRRRCRIDSLCT